MSASVNSEFGPWGASPVESDSHSSPESMARCGTRVKEAVNRALREAAGRQEKETDDLADWFQEVGKRLGEADPRATAWRR